MKDGTRRIDIFGDVAEECATLARRDPVLARALGVIGAPYIRRREAGFAGLFRIVTEQQVSVPSAAAVWARLREALGDTSPARALALGADAMGACGLTRPKQRYVLGLAQATMEGVLDFEAISAMSDEDAMAALTARKGVGPWTAAIYLLFCEGRVDVWPPRDVALHAAFRAAWRRGTAPDLEAFDARAARWRPFRGLAAHILWTYHAHNRGRLPH